MITLALDGPLNGSYITEQQAEDNSYGLMLWPTGEEVYVHESSLHLVEGE